MIEPKLPNNEKERIKCVTESGLLDTLPESDFDNITELVAAICNVPISLITLLDADRNFLKSHHGLDISESPRSISFCGHAILHEEDIFIVEDSRKDKRFQGNPLLEGFKAIFYAGVPLRNPEGLALGTLCVYDHEPRELTKSQINALISLGKQVMNLFDLKKKNDLLEGLQKELANRNKHLRSFASHVSHDLKSPLANISSLTELLKDENKDKLSEESLQYIDYIDESAETLRDYIDGILMHYKADELVNKEFEDVAVPKLFEKIKTILMLKDTNFQYSKDGFIHNQNVAAITQVLLNLVDNAFKYNNKPNPLISLDFSNTDKEYVFKVTDNGKGIKPEKQKDIFNLFSTTGIKDIRGKKGTGIGLYTVKTLVEKLGGTIKLDSEPEKGSTFTFTIAK
ncbi:GAF domain-containing sensor histidine kinase [Oceanihabitans sp. 2_MG-2023]|uniref:sensor histidine kinase n=1 Tax=Oceanihabitans sp. 2_MG-2023 TaxID=3062661 RepID=UPI0026E179A5|nr:GAF domain-containing sensor histidine kinase [Oceanihabitans sp. 2_MG-2023]MDO6596824.1 GAF domain-containing sensor histidine kinase [Oceanihabitans sp. 2_MG-2023]